MRTLRKLYERIQDILDSLGHYWTSKRRIQLGLLLFFYYLVLLTEEALADDSRHKSPMIYSLVVGIDAILVLMTIFFMAFAWVDFYQAEKFYLFFDAASLACMIGWILVKSIYLKEGLIFVILSIIASSILYVVDYTTQRLKSSGKRHLNFSQLYRQHSTKSLDASKASLASLYAAQHDFEAVSPTVNDDSDDVQSSIRLDVNDGNRPALVKYESSSSQASASIVTFMDNTDGSEIEFDGFRVKLTSLPPSTAPAPENVPWESFAFIEHRIDSSSCHIYTAIWKDSPVIIKLIKADRVSSPMAVSEFEMEASILSRVRHPNIVRLLGSGVSPRRFLILELLDGGSLSHALGIRPDANGRYNKKNFSFKQVLQMARSIASALDYLHNRWNQYIHIVHRDIKPDNIGWTSDGVLKVFDFGLCTCVRSQRDRKESYRLTGNTGTLRYMAPEVALGRSYNRTVDVYSFGIILWQILRMQIPFKHMHKKDYMEKVVIGGQRPPPDRRWPKKLRALLDICWHEEKNMRPDFGYVVQEIDSMLKDIEDREMSPLYRMKNTIRTYITSCCRGILWMRPALLITAITFLVLALVLLITIPSEHTHRSDQQETAGIALAIVAFFFCHIISMTLIRGSSRRPLSSRDLIMGLELNQNPTTRYFNPLTSQATDQPALYGL
jgi:serine/threonine protein kinase